MRLVDEAKKAGKPFFLYIPHNAPHSPLMAPPELIAKYRGRYSAGWDRLRNARYRRQIEMGMIQARSPLSPREPGSLRWDSLSPEMQERFDQLMAVYAAMIEAIDTSVGTLVEGLRARGALDDTLMVFLSDNGGNAESGPGGRVEGSPPGGPDSNLYLGMNWAASACTRRSPEAASGGRGRSSGSTKGIARFARAGGSSSPGTRMDGSSTT